jgi:protein-disulfide isomerase
VRHRAIRVGLCGALALWACADDSEPSPGPDPDPVIARLGGEPIRRTEVSPEIASHLYRHEMAQYTLLEQETARLVDQRVLAAEARARGVEPAELLARVEAEVPAPTEAEIDAYLKRHPAAGPPEAARPGVRDYLERNARGLRRMEFVAELRERAGFEWLLAKPEPPRARIAAPDAPARGPADAPVTIVHLASFGSAASARSAHALARLAEALPGRVRWLHVNLPGERDELGRAAAELGYAAQDAGRFWELHDALFAREGRLDAEALAAAAREAGLPGDLLERADRAQLARRLEQDARLARRAGARREPALFVNGRYLGAPGSDRELRKLVDEELARDDAGGRAP